MIECFLEATDGPLVSKRWRVGTDKLFIGRNPDVCAVCFPPELTSVSKIHASVRSTGRGAWLLLADEGSRHGTVRKSEVRLDPQSEVRIAAGDSFWVGDPSYQFTVRAVDGSQLDHETTGRLIVARAMTEEDFAELLEGARQRQNAHIGQLHTLYSARLRTKLRGKYASLAADELDDVVVDTFMALPRLLVWYEDRGRFESWLFEVAKNIARTRRRSRQRDDRHFATSEPDGARDASAIVKLQVADLSGLMARHIERLSAKLRDVMTLHFEGRSTDDISTQLQMSKGAVDVNLTRAKARLAELIGLEQLVEVLGRDATVELVGQGRLLKVFGESQLRGVFGDDRFSKLFETGRPEAG